MTERISITIPDRLHNRLQLVKNSLNVSGICQDAIERAISIEEIKSQEIPQMEKVIERLKLEKRESIEQWKEEWKEIGMKHGRGHSTELSYEEFINLESSNHISEEMLEMLEENYIRFFDDPDRDSYLEGWVEGALSFWAEVKDKLD